MKKRIPITIRKPQKGDLKLIEKILRQWTEEKEVIKYLDRIANEINGQTEFNQQFWVAVIDDRIVGVTGLSDPLPKVVPLAKTKKPGEIKILYVDENHQGKSVGRSLAEFLEKEAEKQGYSELLVRSALKYKDTGWGFYQRIGYQKCGQVSGGDKKNLMQVFGKEL